MSKESDEEWGALTTEELRFVESLLFDARRAAGKLETMYLRREVEPRAELDRFIQRRGEYLTAQMRLRGLLRPGEDNDE
jgi:hypothetical protein